MRIDLFSAKPYDSSSFDAANVTCGHDLRYHAAHLNADSAVLAHGAEAICAFVNDRLDARTLQRLADGGTRLILLRSAGYNHVDLDAAARLGLTVARVPAYSPYSVAEHAVAMILTLNRKTHRAWNRVREGNFELDGLLGFDLHGKTVGVVGTGQIGRVLVGILNGFGCWVLAYDPFPDPSLAARYVPLPQMFAEADILTLQCPLTPDTHHLIDDQAIAAMKPGVMVINTSRGAVIDTQAAIRGLKSGQIGSLGLDVYEEEGDLFFDD
ncbi:2-hydroxyacid dehydrogenase [Pararhodobacter sp. CCB-MM2]|uniref:2-hydroxyacid dehydrogenase n=1 Tax=Pararhodobacter sp. CCB-MM2 TaxID=1786003 RepID=UPI000A8CE3E8|nr:2-hydroxyacid dehydrogenase [Pararhodobacter sp. CCB-MM2]